MSDLSTKSKLPLTCEILLCSFTPLNSKDRWVKDSKEYKLRRLFSALLSLFLSVDKFLMEIITLKRLFDLSLRLEKPFPLGLFYRQVIFVTLNFWIRFNWISLLLRIVEQYIKCGSIVADASQNVNFLAYPICIRVGFHFPVSNDTIQCCLTWIHPNCSSINIPFSSGHIYWSKVLESVSAKPLQVILPQTLSMPTLTIRQGSVYNI